MKFKIGDKVRTLGQTPITGTVIKPDRKVQDHRYVEIKAIIGAMIVTLLYKENELKLKQPRRYSHPHTNLFKEL